MIDTTLNLYKADPFLCVTWITGALFLSAASITKFFLWLMDDKWSIEMDDFKGDRED